MPKYRAFYKVAYSGEREFEADSRETALVIADGIGPIPLHCDHREITVVEVEDIPEEDTWIDHSTD